MSDTMLDLLIIGAGPAGLTAALYAGRFRLKALVVEKMASGGQMLLTPNLENYPGFPGGVSTEDLTQRMRAQVEEVGVSFVSDEVLSVQGSGRGYEVKCREAVYVARTVIIASGAQSKRLGVPGEEALTGRGVSYCGTCDGPLFKNKRVLVVGGGDRAIEDAIFLTSYCSSVTVVHRRQEFRASRILVEKAEANPKITFRLDSVLERIEGTTKVESVSVRNVKTGASESLAADGVFIFVGIVPNTEFIRSAVQTDEAGFIVSDQSMRTSLPGIFACGDCRGKSFYQVISACGEGAHAADSAHKYLLTST
jgi:thioredoxin reductase (NADPH)